MKLALPLALVVAVMFTFPALAGHIPHRWYPDGDVAGGDQLHMPLGGIRGIRNIQCGELTQSRADLNCDFGAGSDTDRGNVNFNWDVGKCVVIFNGRKRPLAKFCPHNIVFYKRPVIRRR